MKRKKEEVNLTEILVESGIMEPETTTTKTKKTKKETTKKTKKEKEPEPKEEELTFGDAISYYENYLKTESDQLNNEIYNYLKKIFYHTDAIESKPEYEYWNTDKETFEEVHKQLINYYLKGWKKNGKKYVRTIDDFVFYLLQHECWYFEYFSENKTEFKNGIYEPSLCYCGEQLKKVKGIDANSYYVYFMLTYTRENLRNYLEQNNEPEHKKIKQESEELKHFLKPEIEEESEPEDMEEDTYSELEDRIDILEEDTIKDLDNRISELEDNFTNEVENAVDNYLDIDSNLYKIVMGSCEIHNVKEIEQIPELNEEIFGTMGKELKQNYENSIIYRLITAEKTISELETKLSERDNLISKLNSRMELLENYIYSEVTQKFNLLSDKVSNIENRTISEPEEMVSEPEPEQKIEPEPEEELVYEQKDINERQIIKITNSEPEPEKEEESEPEEIYTYENSKLVCEYLTKMVYVRISNGISNSFKNVMETTMKPYNFMVKNISNYMERKRTERRYKKMNSYAQKIQKYSELINELNIN